MAHDQLTRSDVLRLGAGIAAACALGPASRGQVPPDTNPLSNRSKAARPMMKRPIPSSGEFLPVIGLGTYINFDVAPGTAEYSKLPAVLDALFLAGGTAIDSSPMYGRAEATTGELLARARPMRDAFLATKVWTRGREAGIQQMTQSFRLLQTNRVDLMQIHNLLDWRVHLPTLRSWKEAGRIRYLGITHYTPSAYPEVEAVMRSERLDFLQINYAMDDRAAEARLLPLARERGSRSSATHRSEVAGSCGDFAASRCRILHRSLERPAGRNSRSNSCSRTRRSLASSPARVTRSTWRRMPLPAPAGFPMRSSAAS